MEISVSNVKYNIDHFVSLVKKYGWGRLAFKVDTGAGAKNIFRQIEHNQIEGMHHQLHENVGLLGIGNL